MDKSDQLSVRSNQNFHKAGITFLHKKEEIRKGDNFVFPFLFIEIIYEGVQK